MVGPRKLRRGEDLCLCCLLLMSLFIPLNSRKGFGLNGSFTAFFFFLEAVELSCWNIREAS